MIPFPSRQHPLIPSARAVLRPLLQPIATCTCILLGLILSKFSLSADENSVRQATDLSRLVAEAQESNPEIVAARREREAAEQRIAPAGALDDPMLEAGILNLPASSLSFRTEDMTMKMLGIEQRLPYPGKRDARRGAAGKEAEIAQQRYRDTVNRVVRDVKKTYFELAFITEATDLTTRNKAVLEQFLSIAQARYAVGQGTQSDVLKSQTQLARMVDELLRRERERPVAEAELSRLLGRAKAAAIPSPARLALSDVPLEADRLLEQALVDQPQLLVQRKTMDRAGIGIDLARRDYYPDFDVKFSYGQRDRTPSGENREDMLSLTVGINLPLWRKDKLDPRVREAIAMQSQAAAAVRAQENDIAAQLHQQVAMAEQSRRSARLYESSILPPARLAVEAALSAYRVNRVDFLTLLDSQMTVFTLEVSRAQALAEFHKALADIDFLSGRPITGDRDRKQ